ncbi:LemA family protein [Lolliginicoccus levis]|uniref:LemA family protein n=1 Tax=Lolliginicoccus levis TaxID=2919542 RepID=UPI00241C55D5|nr:LemA family protein [Lolliginicoccus levis]
MKGIAVGILIAVIVLVVIVIAVLGFWVMSIYNGLVTRRNGYQNAFAQIDVQLTRRHDLIPNLVETAKGYIKHERETLEGVIQARNSAVTAQNSARQAPGDPQAMGELSGAENQLTQSLGRMFALSEAYPDLKANQNMMQLSEELTSTENRVAFARQAFNDAVTAYNIKREVFPGSVIAGMFNFQPAALLEAEGPETREVPKISF